MTTSLEAKAIEEKIEQLKSHRAKLDQLRTLHLELMKRYCAVGSLLPRDVETFDYDDEAAWADVAMVLAELAKIQGEMDALRIQAAVEQSAQ